MRVALNSFLDRVRTIEITASIRDRLVEFGREPAAHLNLYGVMLHSSTRLLGESGLQPMLDGSVLLLCAAFEQFVADIMVSYAQQLPIIYRTYSSLPRAIRTANESFTGEALSNRDAAFEQHEKQRFVENLRSCLSGDAPYVLNGEAIAFNRRNLKAERLRRLFERLGINNVWSVVAYTRSLREWAPSHPPGTARNQAQAELNELIDDRNQIAHKVGSAAPGPDVVRSYLILASAVAKALVESLEIISTWRDTGAAYASVRRRRDLASARP